MLRSLVDLRNYKIQAIDGDLGAVKDELFDDRDWRLRYFVIDTGRWLAGREVLVSPTGVGRADWATRYLRVLLTRDQVRDAPEIDTDPPISRSAEEQLTAYYAWPQYWGLVEPSAVPSETPAEAHETARDARRARLASGQGDADLRSVREVAGYHISARDGHLGHVQDFLGDDGDWVIRYLVLDTRNWLPGKRVLVSPMWIEAVDWKQAEVRVDLTREEIEHAPPYDPKMPMNREYERRLHDFYKRPAYWDMR